MKLKHFIGLSLVLAACSTTAFAAEGFSFSTGIDYSTGKYGQAVDTEILYIPMTAKYEWERFSLRVTVPYLRITGPGNVSPDSRVVVNGNAASTRTTEGGLGDVVLGANYSLLEFPAQQLFVDVGAKVKLPTASESKGLGTGETDYSVQTDVYKTFGKTTVYGGLGYKVLGDPAGVDLRDVMFGSAGLVYKIDNKNSIGAGIDARERTTANSQALREYSVFHSYKFNNTYKLQTYLVFGDTDSSVDFGGGLNLGIQF